MASLDHCVIIIRFASIIHFEVLTTEACVQGLQIIYCNCDIFIPSQNASVIKIDVSLH